jgi:N-acetylmuramic acid 6-phosphate etherase
MTKRPVAPDKARQKAEDFLAVAADFHLGSLPTEQRHPETAHLAALAKNDLPAALALLKKIETDTLAQMMDYQPRLAPLAQAIAKTLADGHRVFFYGCGATGRLSLSIEYIWRFIHRDDPVMAGRVQGFMSGGDLALVHSIENFEDHPEFGARQLRDIGFGPHDLLVATTEGGETPSVIGATEEAARLSSRQPFYLYCNPEEILKETVERSRRVLTNGKIRNICLYVGPMYLSGSTRLQASTVLMLGAGSAMMAAAKKHAAPQTQALFDFIKSLDTGFLAAFIEEESRLYAQGDYLLYETADHGITILTDTTERAPTFSLRGFENQKDPRRVPSLSYLRLPEAKTPAEAWRHILLRDPVTIEWDALKDIAGHDRLMGFDFSFQALEQREKLVSPHRLHRFSVLKEDDRIVFRLGKLEHAFSVAGLHPLHEHLVIKILMNMHSTLVMGRIGRFESNVMTWVKPSNKKLIDRAIRYVQHLLEQEGITTFSYDDICHQIFEEAENMAADQSVVLLARESLRKRSQGL